MDIAIIGAGLTGLSAGYELAKRGFIVNIFENKRVGGLASSYQIGNYYIERYYRHIFRSDDAILQLISDLGLNDNLEWFKGTTGYHIEGKMYPLNTPSEILKFPYLSLSDKIKLGLLVLRSRKKNLEELDDITAKELIFKQCGESLYRNFFEPLLRSKFGDNKDEVSAAWLLSRIKIRSDRSLSGERLGYIRGGFQLLIKRIINKIRDKRCEIFDKKPVTYIVTENKKVKGIKTEDGFIPCKNVISTVSPVILNNILSIPLFSKNIKYQGTACALFGLENKLMEGIYWLNIKADVPFGAVIEHTNFAPIEDYGEHLVYVTSYFQDINDSLWRMSEEKVINLYLRGLKKLFPSFDEKEIRWWKLSRDFDTGPIYEINFRNKVLPYKTKIRGLYLAGMFSPPNYPERSMNGSIKAGFECAKVIANGQP